jgi:hypothetical protein
MAEHGFTHEPKHCRYLAMVDDQMVRLSGYALTEELDQLELFVS